MVRPRFGRSAVHLFSHLPPNPIQYCESVGPMNSRLWVADPEFLTAAELIFGIAMAASYCSLIPLLPPDIHPFFGLMRALVRILPPLSGSPATIVLELRQMNQLTLTGILLCGGVFTGWVLRQTEDVELSRKNRFELAVAVLVAVGGVHTSIVDLGTGPLLPTVLPTLSSLLLGMLLSFEIVITRSVWLVRHHDQSA